MCLDFEITSDSKKKRRRREKKETGDRDRGAFQTQSRESLLLGARELSRYLPLVDTSHLSHPVRAQAIRWLHFVSFGFVYFALFFLLVWNPKKTKKTRNPVTQRSPRQRDERAFLQTHFVVISSFLSSTSKHHQAGWLLQ